MIGQIILLTMLGILTYANLPTKYTLGNQQPTLPYLKKGKLYHIDSSKGSPTLTEIRVSEMLNASPVLVMAIRRVGCKFCRSEAQRLSSLEDQLKQKGIRLIGITHETIGIDAFRPYLKGEIYCDPERHFFGPKQRWMPLWMGILRWSTYVNRYKGEKLKGNLEGEGRLLGGVYLINQNQILYMHLERHWGDHVDMHALQEALNQITN